MQEAEGQEKEVRESLAKLKLEKKKRKALLETMKSRDAPTAETSKVLQFLEAYGLLKKLTVSDVDKAVGLIKEHGEFTPVLLLTVCHGSFHE